MINVFLLRRAAPRWLILFMDLIGVLFAFCLAYWIRFEFHPPLLERDRGLFFLPFWLGGHLLGFVLFKTFDGIIRYSGVKDMVRLVSVIVGVVFALLLINIGRRFLISDQLYFVPISIIVLSFLLEVFILIFFRQGVKWLFQMLTSQPLYPSKTTLLVGFNEQSRIICNALETDPKNKNEIIGIVDVEEQSVGKKMDGIPIISVSKSEEWLKLNRVQEIIFCLEPHQDLERKRWMRRVVDFEIKAREIAPIQEWLDDSNAKTRLKEVSIEDLLGRNVIEINNDTVKEMLGQGTVLVTGAAGSIGSEIVRQLKQLGVKKIIALDQAETPLFELENEIKCDRIEYVIADVRRKERMRRVFEYFHPHVVFHAAAYKHVPMMETNPSEAVLTNVLGTKILADLSSEFGTSTFVLVSTDKAVNPTNVMGASKRAAEIYIQSLQSTTKTRFITTRFGNVLGSNGSVLKIFKKQIEQGGPLTVTHPDITRFFMTIPEAVQLVLEAAAMGQGGEIFVFDMGEKVKIVDLAKKIIRLSGLILDQDISIVYTGLRPGEKLYEEVLSDAETTLPTHHEKILIAKVREYPWNEVKVWVDESIQLFVTQDNTRIVASLKKMIPEFVSQNSEFETLDQQHYDQESR
jgi:FlaA1/EpsC-like NDP-sugar epimerase